MWRFDIGRTNVSPEKMPSSLHLQWLRHLPPVQPAGHRSVFGLERRFKPADRIGHRRLVGEYLNDRWGDVRMLHL